MEKLYAKTGSLYKLVILASKRALELNEGAPKLTDFNSDRVALIALNEIAEDKVTYKKSKHSKE
jgi:DNA-directed RNA polymerase subunit omega